jgi:tetratricopeptide (TPR) repeat protein
VASFFTLWRGFFSGLDIQAFHDHPHYEQLRKSLQACVHEEKRISVHPGEKELGNARYFCARSCREILRNFDSDETWVVSREFEESIMHSAFKFIDEEQGAQFTQLLQASPHNILDLLDTSLRNDALLPTLYCWKEKTESWYSLLIARVYARTFDINPIGNIEANELCEQMLTAVNALPDSPEKQAYEAVYGVIALQLKGDTPTLPTLPTPKSLLQSSHVHAIAILQYTQERQESAWIMRELNDRRGWWDTTHFQLQDQSYSLGTHAYFLYVFPAVRLAFIAAGQRYMLDDPVSQFMRKRLQVNKLLKEHWRMFASDLPAERKRLQRVLAIFQEQLEAIPTDERLWQSCGHLLLRLERPEEAKECLLHCLTMSSCSQDTQATACYNLACVYATMGSDEECRQMLQKSIQHRPLNDLSRDWLTRDPDLESVRQQAWFQALQ